MAAELPGPFLVLDFGRIDGPVNALAKLMLHAAAAEQVGDDLVSSAGVVGGGALILGRPVSPAPVVARTLPLHVVLQQCVACGCEVCGGDGRFDCFQSGALQVQRREEVFVTQARAFDRWQVYEPEVADANHRLGMGRIVPARGVHAEAGDFVKAQRSS